MNEPTTLTPKERLAIPQQDMPAQEPETRRNNMSEVALGYTPEMARAEASRCLNCPTKPCVAGCPVGVDIPAFVKLIEAGDDAGALSVIKRTNLLPAICGRVCPQEKQCMSTCTVGKLLKDPMKAVAIGRLERYASESTGVQKFRSSGVQEHIMRKAAAPQAPTAPTLVGPTAPTLVGPTAPALVGVIGAGPAGLTFAADVARAGHKVVVFEALQKPGGVLVYGIPEFRLPKKIVEAEIENLKTLGVEIRTNFIVGRSRPLKKLLEEDGFSAVFIGSGAGLPSFMRIPGENLKGVYSANEFLTRVNLMKAYQPGSSTPVLSARRVAVVGGGNVAMDAARCAKRLGAEEVTIVYRRSRVELPARAEEVDHAEEEGIIFRLLCNPVSITEGENGYVSGMECVKMELGEPDASGRRRPVVIEGSNFHVPAECVIIAIGTSPNPLLRDTTDGLSTEKWGGIIIDEQTGATSIPGVFAGGDAVSGAATVILAMGAGKKAAKGIDQYIQSGV
ncbi:MAG: NADPH-dependent glutamate synthase [Kiritimatiellaeota bacterium]|nr:NADPH-dependent glutamate synthase [Kiritimatiellota bacterium]